MEQNSKYGIALGSFRHEKGRGKQTTGRQIEGNYPSKSGHLCQRQAVCSLLQM